MDAVVPIEELDRSVWKYRMKDLCEATGLERQAIHFYIQQGLLRPGRKTGKNMAFYSEEHLSRLQLIKKLQHERFLPLKAIKALLDGREEAFAPEQYRFLAEVKTKLRDSILPPAGPTPTVDLDDLMRRTGVDRHDVDRAAEIGLITIVEDETGSERIPEESTWMFELFGQLRQVGFTRELGFTVDDVAFYEDTVNKLFREEVRLISSRLNQLPPEQVAGMIERALPVIHALLIRYHAAKVRDFFGSMF